MAISDIVKPLLFQFPTKNHQSSCPKLYREPSILVVSFYNKES